MLRILICAILAACIACSSAFAETPSGTYAVRVPTKTPFISTITLKSGQVTKFTMQNNEILTHSAKVSGTSIVIDAQFLGRCGAGSKGQMKIDISGSDLIFREWKGRCAKKSKNFKVSKKIKMKKQ